MTPDDEDDGDDDGRQDASEHYSPSRRSQHLAGFPRLASGAAKTRVTHTV